MALWHNGSNKVHWSCDLCGTQSRKMYGTYEEADLAQTRHLKSDSHWRHYRESRSDLYPSAT